MDEEAGKSVKNELLHKTISWLKTNYSFVEGVSTPRQILYENYQSYCALYKYFPVSTATFGKIIRQQFPQITTRRLGNRGHSKYHYHGLSVKENSIYFDCETFRSSSSMTKTCPATNVQHPKNRNDSVPKIQLTIDIPKTSTSEDRINSDMGKFFIMYQTHSQQLIDSIVHGSFEEIEKYLHSFWKGCPEHFTYLFDKPLLIDGVIVIDVQVYVSVYRFVLHSMNQSLPDQYLNQFVMFLECYSTILLNVIPTTTNVLKEKKIFYALMFKQMCLNWLRGSHLYQIIFPVISTTDFISEILEDFQSVCLDGIVEDTSSVLQGQAQVHVQHHLYNYFDQFENLLEIDFSFDSTLKWIQSIFQDNWTQVNLNYKDCYLIWSIFFSKFLKEMLINTLQCFAQTNLVFLWLEHLFFTESMMREFESVISLNNADKSRLPLFNHPQSTMESMITEYSYFETCKMSTSNDHRISHIQSHDSDSFNHGADRDSGRVTDIHDSLE